MYENKEIVRTMSIFVKFSIIDCGSLIFCYFEWFMSRGDDSLVIYSLFIGDACIGLFPFVFISVM